MSMNTYMTSGNGYNVPTGDPAPMRTPAGLLVTRAVETKDGWKGQIIVDRNIVWESQDPHKGDSFEAEKEALAEANRVVVDRLARLFSG